MFGGFDACVEEAAVVFGRCRLRKAAEYCIHDLLSSRNIVSIGILEGILYSLETTIRHLDFTLK